MTFRVISYPGVREFNRSLMSALSHERKFVFFVVEFQGSRHEIPVEIYQLQRVEGAEREWRWNGQVRENSVLRPGFAYGNLSSIEGVELLTDRRGAKRT